MNDSQVRKAELEAKRFLETAFAFRKRLSEESCYQTKEGGALRRASMDLTRALANMRRA